jgi:hypothetical protein
LLAAAAAVFAFAAYVFVFLRLLYFCSSSDPLALSCLNDGGWRKQEVLGKVAYKMEKIKTATELMLFSCVVQRQRAKRHNTKHSSE